MPHLDVGSRLSRTAKFLLQLVFTVGFVLVILLLNAADIWSCFGGSKGDRTAGDSLAQLISLPDSANSGHRALFGSLRGVWVVAAPQRQDPTMLVVRSSEINAASFGQGRFLVWEGLSNMPAWAIDAIMSHEVAHDLLRHSKKASELQELVDFFAEILTTIGGRDENTNRVVYKWTRSLVLPKYSRQQEFAADSVGALILAEAGYRQPSETMAETLELLLHRYGNAGGGMFDYHPSVTDRIATLRRATAPPIP
jgi:Zn-dependent protease with chaperone function